MHPQIGNWRPASVESIDAIVGGFQEWCLCGGQSLDVLAGRATRKHGDTDIGVYRSALPECLRRIQRQRVFLCGPLRPWDGGPVPPDVHDIWVTDDLGGHWVLQIVIYEDDGRDKYTPSVDRLFISAAKRYGERVLAVVLTGMGDDGREGACQVKAAKGRVIAESEETAVIYGMPRQVVNAGLADQVLPLQAIPAAVQSGIGGLRAGEPGPSSTRGSGGGSSGSRRWCATPASTRSFPTATIPTRRRRAS